MIRLDLKNCLFIVTGQTQLWICRLKIFYLTSKCKKKKKRKKNELNLLPKVTVYFNPKFHFSNACLDSVEHLFPSTKN